MLNNESLQEDSFNRYIRLITETVQRKLLDCYEVKLLSKDGRYSFYELKDKDQAESSIHIEATGVLWKFTMNQGLDKLFVSLGNQQLVDKQGIISLEDLVKGTRMYEHHGTMSFIYRRSKSSMSLEEYFFGGGRDVNVRDTLRPATPKLARDLAALKRNQNHLLSVLITALVALKMINYGPLEPMK